MRRKRPKIILMGGLGNQLFQYAFGILIRERNKIDVYFSDSLVDGKSVLGSTPRTFSLDGLIEKHSLVRTSKAYLLISRFWSVIFRNHFLREGQSDLDFSNKVSNRASLILGYFQNWAIVEEVWPILRNKMLASSRFSSVLTNDGQSKYLAVHIRLGDYRTLDSAALHHGVTDISYYLEAIERLSQITNFEEIRLISDEPELAFSSFMSYYKGLIPVVDASKTDEVADLVTIANARGVVMSNSTFSWWGAWIAHKERNALVVMPDPWFVGTSGNPVTLGVPGWLILSRKMSTDWLGGRFETN